MEIKLIKIAEKFFKTDINYLIKGGFWLTSGQILTSLSSLILAIAFANLLERESYGTYRYILSAIGIISLFTLPGINTSLIRSIANNFSGSYLKAIKTKFKFSLIATIACLIVGIYYFYCQNNEIAFCFFIIASIIPFNKSSELYLSVLNGQKRFKLYTILYASSNIIATLSIILTLFFTDSLALILTSYFLSYTILQLIFSLYVKKYLNNNEADNTVEYGIHLSIMDVIKTIAGHLDRILIFNAMGPLEVAIYSFAVVPHSQAKSFLENIKVLAFPKLSASNEEDIRKFLPKKILKMELIIAILVIIYIFAAPTLFQIFLPKYMDSVLYSQVYFISLIFFPRTILSTAMTAKIKKKELYSIRILSPILRIILMVVGLKFFQLWGVLVAGMAANALMMLIYGYYFKKAFKQITYQSSL
ncbi:MAG: oligosaccharide flippase family protein [Patescibacteria group bacterium]|nr:oligosaccharide flippase family protein [Patescibacteria group bacterium]